MTQLDSKTGLSPRRAATKAAGLPPDKAGDFVLRDGVPECRPQIPAQGPTGGRLAEALDIIFATESNVSSSTSPQRRRNDRLTNTQ